MELNMEANPTVVVRCTWGSSGFMSPLTIHSTYDNLEAEIRTRFRFRRDDIITIQYSLAGCSICFLQNQRDFELLFFGAKIYKVQCVEILVLKENRNSSSSSTVSHVGSSITYVDEDDDYDYDEEFLGAAFKCEVSKPLLSDEWSTYITGPGQRFIAGIEEFRGKLKKYSIQIGFIYGIKRNDGVRMNVICNSGGVDTVCDWFINGSVASVNESFYIHEMCKIHTCRKVVRTSRHPSLDSDVVASCIESDVMFNMGVKPNTIMDRFRSAYGFDITYKVASKAIVKAKNRIYGRDEETFDRLSWYRDAVMESNPGSVFELEVDETTKRFKRVFVVYGGCLKGFEFCLPVLYVDGTFAKSVYKGQILAATGRNGNKGFYPLAICLCDAETEDNWNFFFKNLKKVIETQGRVITFISDRGTGLLGAFDDIFPGNPHLYCYKHLTYNLAKRYTGKGNSTLLERVKFLFFKLAYSSTEKEYNFNLRAIKAEGKEETITAFLSDMPVEHWCRAFFKGCRYGIMANGIAESFNSWISFERTMPVYVFLEEVRLKIMEMNSERRDLAESWLTKLTPKLERRLEMELKKSVKFSVHHSSAGVYEVRSEYSYSVNLNERTCSCVKWQINCFPCPHALACIQLFPRDEVYEYIDPLFHVDSFIKCYSFAICPVSNVDESNTDHTDEYIYPPIAKRPPGRRKNKRIESSGEVVRKMITCGRCGKQGNHNRLTCTEALD